MKQRLRILFSGMIAADPFQGGATWAVMRGLPLEMQKAMIAGFTAAERDDIRRERDQFFSTLPTVADGLDLA